MAKKLPANFPMTDPRRLQVGGKIAARDWDRLIERSHYLWSSQTAYVGGWYWPWEPVDSGIQVENALSGPWLSEYNPIILPRRPLDGDVVRIGVIYLTNAVTVTCAIHRLSYGTALPVFVDNLSLVAGAGTDALSATIDIDLADLLVSGEIQPVVLTFSATATAAEPRIEYLQPFEAGPGDAMGDYLAPADIP